MDDRRIPEGWRECKLGEVLCENGYIRGPFGSSLRRGEMKNYGIPVYEQKNVINNERYFRFFINEEKFQELSRFQVKTDDLIISCSGTIGKISIINEDDPKGIISQALLILRPDIEKIELMFLYYFLSSKKGFELLTQASHGSVQVNIAERKVVESIPILLPPLSEQRAIASVLSSLDDKIDLLNRENQTLEHMAEAIFRQWFIEEADEKWEEKQLGELITVKRGGSPRPIQDYLSETGYLWLKISDATNEKSPYIFEVKEHIKKSGLSKTILLKKGSLVLSNSATPGIPKILEVDACIHDGWLYFPNSYFSKEFLYLLFKTIRENLISYGNGSIFINLKTDILKNYKISVPEEKDLLVFQRKIESYFNKIIQNCIQIRTLEKLRDTLLPKLMSGEVRVKL